MKLNSKVIKAKIVEKVKSSPESILRLWHPEDQPKIEALLPDLEKESSWKRESKEKDDDFIERRFIVRNGSELDEELSVFVYTNLDDTEIVRFSFEA